jgi:hypothetical protein
VSLSELYGAHWYNAHQRLQAYLTDLGFKDQARDWASQACGLWLRSAFDGVDMPSGPYANLYACAVMTANLKGGALAVPSLAECEDKVPLDAGAEPYVYSRLYAEAYKLAELSNWSRSMRNLVSKSFGRMYPVNRWNWKIIEGEVITEAASLATRRAFALLHDHECFVCLVCASSSCLWDAQDTATEVWLTTQRLAREGI